MLDFTAPKEYYIIISPPSGCYVVQPPENAVRSSNFWCSTRSKTKIQNAAFQAFVPDLYFLPPRGK